MIKMRCAKCDRHLLTVTTGEPAAGETAKTWRVRAKCHGCDGSSFWHTMAGRLFPLGAESRTVVCDQTYDDESVTFHVRPL